MANIGRNEPCSCGSSKKYKKCCGSPLLVQQPSLKLLHENEIPPRVKLDFEMQKAHQITRQQQQGLGKPIISFESNGYRIVFVGNTMYCSKEWKTFHDFLLDYIEKVLTADWANKEIRKPLAERHPILQWYYHVYQYYCKTVKELGKVSFAPMIGAVKAYMDLAYTLYLLKHNITKNQFNMRLQNRLISRLKNINEFPGAYYESYIGAILIKAGFEIEFGDEISGKSAPDYIINRKIDGSKYTVEAKAIRRTKALGATSGTGKSLAGSIRDQLRDALEKPSTYPRVIFIEANLPVKITNKKDTDWLKVAVDAVKGAEDLTVKGVPTESAYVIITNNSHHYHLLDGLSAQALVAIGYKIPDFGYSTEFFNFREKYYAKQKHIAIYNVMDSLATHYDIPITFNGDLPSKVFYSNPQHFVIGETYFFENIGTNGMFAKVISAAVNKLEKAIYIVTDKGQILTHSISAEELQDFEKHPDTFFGVLQSQGKNIKEPYELFEWMLNTYINTPKEKLLEFMQDRSDIEQLKTLDQQELAITYCERNVYSCMQNFKRKE